MDTMMSTRRASKVTGIARTTIIEWIKLGLLPTKRKQVNGVLHRQVNITDVRRVARERQRIR